tara:strand:+ start:691 stop:1683 length:993 start_codon:yes stop_codon:yes gene_type:complete
MNSNIISGLETLIQSLRSELDKTGNKLLNIKINTYTKVIKIIQKIDYKITEGEQLKDEKGIGPSTIKHINNILSNNTQIDDSITEIKNLQRITGIGPVKSKKIYEAGYTLNKILDDFKKGKLTYDLTHHQILGIKHFHDLEKRIPYGEITEIESYLNDLITMLKLKIKLVICGSYRRKAVDSGDIDILIYNPSVKSNKDIKKDNYLPKLLEFLNKVGFLKDHLTSLDSPTKYMGMCSIKEYPIRRIDIRFVPMDCIYSAMLYFTGSGEFNLNMRAFAKKKGYTINEYGIYKLVNGKKGDKVDIVSEEDIFKILDLEYVEPNNRLPNYVFK